MSKTQLIQNKLGITRGQTFVSLSLAGLMVFLALSAATWVWSMDSKLGDQLAEIDKRVVALEAHDKDEARRLARMEKQLDEIHRMLLESHSKQ